MSAIGGFLGVSAVRLCAVAVVFLYGCSSRPSPQPSAPTSTRGYPLAVAEVQNDGQALAEFRVEVADNADARRRGLSGIESLNDTDGMVFLQERPVLDSFWMKDTLIPLDLAFWNSDGEIFQIVSMEPCTADPCELYKPQSEWLGAIEVPQGELSAKGVKTGHRVEIRRIS